LCMGFAIMSRSEGPKTFFEFICHRFSKAPKMIVYDNCCNLHRYCLRREPNFFSQTWFLIDRLHQRGHIACHEGYNMDVYLRYGC
jgi:L-lysine 2,3-aminomutase